VPKSLPRLTALLAMLTAVALAATATASATASASPSKSATAKAAGAGCRGQHAKPTSASVTTIRRATLCLINRERRARGLRALRMSRTLARPAQRHSADMAARRYFSHTSPAGTTMSARIARSGYTRGRRYVIGENIAWGTGTVSTPASIVRSWMRSPGHRANILSPRYREIGIGVVRRAPDGAAGATYTTNFGART
jgi:uncharacterized protein YkwD